MPTSSGPKRWTLKAVSNFISLILYQLQSRTSGNDNSQFIVPALSDAEACKGAWLNTYPEWLAFDGGLAPHENTYGYIEALKPDACKDAKQKPKWNPGFKIVNAVRDFSCLYDDIEYNETDLKMQRLILETGGVVTGVAAADPKIEYYKGGIAQNCEKYV